MRWNMMSEMCFAELSAILRMLKGSPFSDSFKEALKKELEENKIERAVSIDDCYAAADCVLVNGIYSGLPSELQVEVDTKEGNQYRGLVRHFFKYAKQVASLDRDCCDTLGAVIQCSRLLTYREVASIRLPLSWNGLLKAQKAWGNLFGFELPDDILLPTTRQLMLAVRKSYCLSVEVGSEQVLAAIPYLSEKQWVDKVFNPSQGKFMVIGSIEDNFVKAGEFSTLEEAIEFACFPREVFDEKYVYDWNGYLVW
jgi:hypothetical protein